MTESTTNNSSASAYDCQQARLCIGAEPTVVPEVLANHLRDCESCAAYQRQMLRLEHAITRALAVPVAQTMAMDEARRRSGGFESGDNLAARRPPERATQARVPFARLALAASLVLAVTIGILLWAARPDQSLAADVVAHIEGEAASWRSTATVPDSALALVLRKSGIELAPGAVVSYAQSCWFRGKFVPHLVVQSARGPVTVMILPGEYSAARERFDEAPYTGVIAPVQGGSVAVLARDGVGDVDAVLENFLVALKPPAAR